MSERHETIVILDFGSQYTQLIARRIREQGVYCEILPFSADWETIERRRPRGIVLSGGPESVFAEDAPHPDRRILDRGRPLLGICYGMQLIAHHFGARVEPGQRREYGRAELTRIDSSPLLDGVKAPTRIWMSHGDHVEGLPAGFRTVARTNGVAAAIENGEKSVFGVQFHPEVAHTDEGERILRNYLFQVCGCRGDWTVASFVEESVEAIRRQVGPEDGVLCGLSGGVDTTVAAMLVQRAVGDRLDCVFVDNGLLRKDEFESVLGGFRDQLRLPVTGVDESSRFLDALAGVEDPERKRRIIGEHFIRVFEEQARKLGSPRFLVQGTLYPDVIESVSVKGPSATIKTHHNVGGLPDDMEFELVEPLRELFKDEVRNVGRELGVPKAFLRRHPFPGPGLAVRILGSVDEQRLAVLREADAILIEELERSGLYDSVWQAFAVLLPVRSVGVMGDGRTYENVAAIRAVESRDGMTADWASLPHDVLGRISTRIVKEVPGINRVVYDITSQPPGTIEWE